MTQNHTGLQFKKIEYLPRWNEKCKLTGNLIFFQIEFSKNEETFIFPDFDNIFSRSNSAKEWWFLSPELNDELIFQDELEVSKWWDDIQQVYDRTILSKMEPSKNYDPLLDIVTLTQVNFLWDILNFGHTFNDDDEKHRMLRFHGLLHDNVLGGYWIDWLKEEVIINYYHILFAPILNNSESNRESARLSNRFPEYAAANKWCKDFEYLLSNEFQQDEIDIFNKARLFLLKKQIEEVKSVFTKYLISKFCQCRVCGKTFSLPMLEKGNGKGKGKGKKTCSDDCKRAWDNFGSGLPENPKDSEGRLILISQI